MNQSLNEALKWLILFAVALIIIIIMFLRVRLAKLITKHINKINNK